MTMGQETEKPTIIIVPGGWHVPIHYEPLTSRLEQAGYTVHALHLPSTGDEPTTPNHDEDVTLIRNTIQQASDKGEDIVLVVHSAGGVTGSEAAKGMSKAERQEPGKEGGIVRMVYICAFAAPEGVSVFSAINGPRGPSSWVSIEGPISRPTDPEYRFYHDLSPTEAEAATGHLKMHSAGALWSPATYAAWKHIPSTFLVCENDRTIPLVAQEAMIGHVDANFTVERCAAGHAPMLSMPDFTAQVVRRAAGEDIAVKL